jgi:hypothetical protein
MRKIIIAGLAMLTTLAAVLAAVLGSGSGPVNAAVVATTKAAPASAVTAASTNTSLVNLAGVSCVAADFCVAVGFRSASDLAPRHPIAMIWNGVRWRSTEVSLPKGWPGGELASVSCASAVYCAAVGGYFKTNSSLIPVAVTWNGRAWTAARALPSVAGSRPYATDISCAAARHCVVSVAANPTPKSGQAFIDVLAGATWTVHALTPAKGSQASGENVSCSSVTHCVITGEVYTRPGEAPLLALWNGKALSTMKATENFPAEFDGLSCPSARSCVTVGTWFTGPADLGYYGIWNGSIWKGARILPQPKAMVLASPSAVSCPVTTRCLAVGFDRVPGKNNAYPNQALAEFFNGRGWTRLSVPAPAGAADTEFAGVSCVSATSCVAVGSTVYFTNPKTSHVTALTGIWNGKHWRLVPAA